MHSARLPRTVARHEALVRGDSVVNPIRKGDATLTVSPDSSDYRSPIICSARHATGPLVQSRVQDRPAKVRAARNTMIPITVAIVTSTLEQAFPSLALKPTYTRKRPNQARTQKPEMPALLVKIT